MWYLVQQKSAGNIACNTNQPCFVVFCVKTTENATTSFRPAVDIAPWLQELKDGGFKLGDIINEALRECGREVIAKRLSAGRAANRRINSGASAVSSAVESTTEDTRAKSQRRRGKR